MRYAYYSATDKKHVCIATDEVSDKLRTDSRKPLEGDNRPINSILIDFEKREITNL